MRAKRITGWKVWAASAGVWLVLSARLFAQPALTDFAAAGDDLTRNTVRLALLYYAAAVVWMLRGGSDATARCWWTLAWLAYVVHLAVAFHCYHGWSHERAVEHVRARSGVGEGIYVSHLFTLLWTADVLWWWYDRGGHGRRPAWVGWALHTFMTFIVINGTIVYESGPIRWFAVGFYLVAAWLWVAGAKSRTRDS